MHQAGRETFPSYVLDSLGEAGVAEEDFVLIHRVVWRELLRSDRGYRLHMNNTFFLGTYPGNTSEKLDYIEKVIESFFNSTL